METSRAWDEHRIAKVDHKWKQGLQSDLTTGPGISSRSVRRTAHEHEGCGQVQPQGLG